MWSKEHLLTHLSVQDLKGFSFSEILATKYLTRPEKLFKRPQKVSMNNTFDFKLINFD